MFSFDLFPFLFDIFEKLLKNDSFCWQAQLLINFSKFLKVKKKKQMRHCYECDDCQEWHDVDYDEYVKESYFK